MRVAIGQFSSPTDELVAFAQQLGVSGVLLNTPDLPGTERWEYDDLRRLCRCCGDHGLRLEAIENTPITFPYGQLVGDGAGRGPGAALLR